MFGLEVVADVFHLHPLDAFFGADVFDQAVLPQFRISLGAANLTRVWELFGRLQNGEGEEEGGMGPKGRKGEWKGREGTVRA